MPAPPEKKEEKKIELKSTFKIPKLNSLKEEINKPKVQEEVVLDMNVRNHFTLDDLKKYWNDYAVRMKQEKRDIEYVILANRSLQMDDNYHITIELDNQIQSDQFNSFRADFADYLRKSLRNNHLMIEAHIKQSENIKIIYTSEDKLKYLTQKYPLLEDLKKRLGLDTDF